MQKRKAQRFETDEFDNSPSDDDDWRKLASFGVERNQDFDLNEEFGAVTAEQNIEGTIDLVGQMNAGYATHEMKLKVRIWFTKNRSFFKMIAILTHAFSFKIPSFALGR